MRVPTEGLPVIQSPENQRSINDNCGVVGIYMAPEDVETFRDQDIGIRDIALDALKKLKHRGQQNTGMSVSEDGYNFPTFVTQGPAHKEFEAELPKSGVPRFGRFAVGHDRYATSGGLNGGQPTKFHIDNNGRHTLPRDRGDVVSAHNGAYSNYHRITNGKHGEQPSDSWLLASRVADEMEEGITLPAAMIRMARIAQGAWTTVAAAENQLAIMRDPHGMRPGSLARFGVGSWMVASETVAFPDFASYVRPIRRGEILTIDESGLKSMQYTSPESFESAFCKMEDIYIASPDHLNVRAERQEAGRILAREAPVDADLVVPLLGSGREYAEGYAEESGIPYLEAIAKIGDDRAFMGNGERKLIVVGKHSIDPDAVDGKRLVIVDDSIVRGDTFDVLAQGLREAGALEIHIRIGSPPIKYPCFYGVDFPDPTELAMYNNDVESTRKRFGVTSLHYISMEGSDKAFGGEGRCKACFTGEYPTSVLPIELGIPQLLAHS